MRNSGNWTEAKFNSFVKSALRAASRRWPPKYETLNDACVGPLVNQRTGRIAKHYKCAVCMHNYPAADVQVDHILPVVDPTTGFVSWDETINRMFCEKENLQVLCTVKCHKDKTKLEKELAAARKKANKVSE